MATATRWTTGLLFVLVAPACRDDAPPPPLDDGTTTAASESGDETTGDPPPGLPPLPPRPEALTCRFDGWAPGLLPPLAFEPEDVPAVPGARALALGLDGVVLVGTEDGRLVALSPDDPVEPLRELRPADGSRITGLAFDAGTGPSMDIDALYVRSETDAPARTRVTRFTLTDPRTLDPASALEVIAIDHDDPASRRGAGLLATDGLLWIPLGDDAVGDETGPADDPQVRPGNLLRLDVSTLAAPGGWSLPPDNPLVGEGGTAAEAWAWGLRDPGGCVHDPVRARLWCTDAGAAISEASLVPPGVSLGWPRLEGSECRVFGGCENLDTQLPQASYRHAEDDCGVGPAAHADGMDAELDGALVYADRCSGKLFAARPPEADRKGARAVVGRIEPALAAMAADPQGGLWAVDANGRLGRLVVARPPGQFPTSLSQSGCFVGTGVGTPRSDLVPYALNAPLWTDGSHKQRYIVLPPGTRIGLEDDGSLAFPEGTVILKNFSYAKDPFEPEVLTPVETRVMIRRGHGWEFHGYAWDEDGVDAQLLDEGTSQVLLTSHAGAPTIVRHTFPSRDECGYCHGTGDVRALGPRLDQLARSVHYDGVGEASQLDALDAIGMFDGPVPEVEPMTDYADEDAPDEARARAWLHANCGHCHRPGGWTPPDLDMDLRWSTSLPETRLCGVPPQYSSTFDAEHRVAPGDPADSLVWLRLSSRGPWQMPPVATSIPDPQGAVVRAWIEGLDGCPSE
jgi:uncharacterized repeat protein (TIGR03806 family)